MYCLCLSSPDPKIDFWWIKPMATNSAVIEPQTLDRQVLCHGPRPVSGTMLPSQARAGALATVLAR
jgi:hypothetical protein